MKKLFRSSESELNRFRGHQKDRETLINHRMPIKLSITFDFQI